MPKILVTATVPGHIERFHLPLLRRLSGAGWEVQVASGGDLLDESITKSHVLPWTRSPFSIGNIRAYRQLKSLLDGGHFDVVYCHTPVGGAVTRLAARDARKRGTKVVYMAHGFHFYKGAPLVNWLVYYPVEKLLSHLTDDLLVINREDFDRASKKFPTNVVMTRGVGIDFHSFEGEVNDTTRTHLRESIGLQVDRPMVLAVGELNKNKNHELLIRAWAAGPGDGVDADLVVAGKGVLREQLEDLAGELGVADRVHLLGYRTDIPDLVSMADLLVSSSRREGMGLNVVEAMAVGTPVLLSPNRGHLDLITHGATGFLTQGFAPEEWALALRTILVDPDRLSRVGAAGRVSAHKYELQEALPLVQDCIVAK